MTTLAPYIFRQYFDNNGDPLNAGLVYAYEAGTSTPKDTYTDSTGGTANANPVVLDSAGRAAIWLGDGGYKFVIKDSAGTTIDTVDNVGGSSSLAFGGTTTEIATNTAVAASDANTAYIATAALTLSLLAVATAGEGFYVSVFAQGGAVIIDPNSSETVNNAATVTIKQGQSGLVISDGDEWWVFFQGAAESADNAFTGSNSFSGTTTLTGKTIFPDDGELTIATGAVTVTGVFHTVDTESDAASDDLDTISGGADGQILILQTENSSRDVTLTTAGNIVTPDAASHSLTTLNQAAVLIYSGALSKWVLVSYPIGAATATEAGIVEKATQAEMEAETADKYPDASIQQYHPGHPKAWCRFNGTGTPAIISSYNASSITDNGTGNFTVNWSITMANTNYCVICSGGRAAGNGIRDVYSTTHGTAATTVNCVDATNTLTDFDIVEVAIFGDI